MPRTLESSVSGSQSLIVWAPKSVSTSRRPVRVFIYSRSLRDLLLSFSVSPLQDPREWWMTIYGRHGVKIDLSINQRNLSASAFLVATRIVFRFFPSSPSSAKLSVSFKTTSRGSFISMSMSQIRQKLSGPVPQTDRQDAVPDN